ncbi:hypothetical protein AB1287_00585 [Enterobacter asburiae]|uniref:hypothetical protein n=1 Tax=Scandinavium sp. UTDF21-P1B TaxID=3446379 RepID=UPI00348733C0
MNRKVFLSFLILAPALVAGMAVWLFSRHASMRETLPECRAITVFHNYQYRSRIIFNFWVHGDTGRLFFEGPVFEGEKQIGMLHRKIDFRLNRMPEGKGMHGAILYKSYNMTVYPKDNLSQEVVGRFLPPFFIASNHEIYFDLTDTSAGLFLVKDNVPMLFCRHN